MLGLVNGLSASRSCAIYKSNVNNAGLRPTRRAGVRHNATSGPGLTSDSHGSLGVQVWGMRRDISTKVSAVDRARLESGHHGPEQPAEARLAGEDHPGDRGRPRHRRDHAPERQVEAERLALAGAVHDGWRGRASRDKTRPSRIPPLEQTIIDRVIALTATETAAPSHPLDGGGDGRGGRDQHQLGAAHLAGAKLQPHRVRSSNSPPTRSSPPGCAISPGSTSIRRRMPWCSRSTRSRKSKRSIGPNRGCP